VHRFDGGPRDRRLLPDGRVNLVWIAGTGGVQVSGPQTRFGRPPDLDLTVVLGAAFRPGAAPAALRTPASELVDAHVPLDAVAPRLAATLDERLGDAPDVRAALEGFAAELGRHLAAATAPDPAVREAIRVLDRTGATVADAAAHTFVSERQLQRRFVDHVGYGPKTLQRVLRFQRFLREITAPRVVGLAGAAALAGYADQAHLSRETRQLAGLSPRELRHWRH
jgi:AraC-like DNA-binding protein